MRVRELQHKLWIPRPLAEVFPFFADAGNLELFTPPWMRFHIVTPRPIAMRVGALIDYRLRVRGLPLRWQSEITAWEPPHRFADVQRRGPYRLWHHEHRFEPRNGGTLCIDHVRYAVPFDFIAQRFIVGPDIARIFAFREEKLRTTFSGKAAAV